MKALLEHLQTIHLALVVTCLALIGATMITPTATSAKAIADLATLIRMSSELDETWMNTAAIEKISTARRPTGDDGIAEGYVNVMTTFYSPKGVSIPFAVIPDEWAVLPPKWNTEAARADPHRIFESGGFLPNRIKVPADVSAWRLVWDQLADVSWLVANPRAATSENDCLAQLSVPPYFKPTSLSLDALQPGQPIVPCRVSVMPRFPVRMNGETVRAHLEPVSFNPSLLAPSVPEGGLPSGELALLIFRSNGDVMRTWSSYTALKSTFVPQQWLATRFNARWPTGRFDVSFPELSEITKEYQELPLAQARRILSAEAARDRPAVTLGGVTVPAAAVSSVGTVVLLVMQLYFCVQLGRVLIPIQTEATLDFVPWVAIYHGIEARILSVMTTAVLPVSVVGKLMWNDPHYIALALAVVVSTALAVRALILLRRVWKLDFRFQASKESPL
jgi:hypothetical protein